MSSPPHKRKAPYWKLSAAVLPNLAGWIRTWYDLLVLHIRVGPVCFSRRILQRTKQLSAHNSAPYLTSPVATGEGALLPQTKLQAPKLKYEAL